MGVDGRHTHQRVCLSYYPPTAGTQQRWALTEAGTVHRSRYIILAALYRHWKYGGSIHCHARTTELRTGSFICVDVPPPFQHKPIQRDLSLENLRTYSRHISTTAKITFEAARSWIGREPSLELLGFRTKLLFLGRWWGHLPRSNLSNVGNYFYKYSYNNSWR